MTDNIILPDWLTRALAEYSSTPSSKEPKEDWPLTPKRGELRVAYPMDPGVTTPRMVLIADVSPSEGFVSAVLMSADIDMATDWDLQVDPQETGLAYKVIVELDVIGPLWFVQLGPPLGAIPSQLVGPIVRATAGDPSVLPAAKRDLPVRQRTGLRWFWKRRELSEFHRLTSDCGSSLVEADERTIELIDYGLLDPSTTTERCLVALLDHLEYIQPPPARILEILLSAELLTVERWRQTVGIDAWNAIEPLIYRGILTPSPSMHVTETSRWHPERSRTGVATEALRQTIEEQAARGQRRVYLKTSKVLWQLKDDPGETAIFAVDTQDRGRVQIVSHVMDGEG